MSQLDIFRDFVKAPVIHSKENNSESESFLNENKKKFSSQCALIMHHFKLGRRLSRRQALIEFNIQDFIKRINELRHENNIKVRDQWVTDSTGKKLYKEYFL